MPFSTYRFLQIRFALKGEFTKYLYLDIIMSPNVRKKDPEYKIFLIPQSKDMNNFVRIKN